MKVNLPLRRVVLVPDRQEQPRQLGRPGSKRPLRWLIRGPGRSGEIRDAREREPATGRDHGPRRSRARHAFADEKSLEQKREEDSIIWGIERLQ